MIKRVGFIFVSSLISLSSYAHPTTEDFNRANKGVPQIGAEHFVDEFIEMVERSISAHYAEINYYARLQTEQMDTETLAVFLDFNRAYMKHFDQEIAKKLNACVREEICRLFKVNAHTRYHGGEGETAYFYLLNTKNWTSERFVQELWTD